MDRFRGSAPARLDEKGRLKVPNLFRQQIEEAFGRDLFVTSISRPQLPPLSAPIWRALEEKLAELPAIHRAKNKFLERVNYFGQDAAIDGQGRVLVPQILRDAAKLPADVVVTGNIDHLVVSDRGALARRLPERGVRARGLRRAVEAAAVREPQDRESRRRNRLKPAHTPVLLEEVVELLAPERGGFFVDATVGAGGHAEAILERGPRRAAARYRPRSRGARAGARAAGAFRRSRRARRGELRRSRRGALGASGAGRNARRSRRLLDAARSGARGGSLSGGTDHSTCAWGEAAARAADIVATASVDELTRIFRE